MPSNGFEMQNVGHPITIYSKELALWTLLDRYLKGLHLILEQLTDFNFVSPNRKIVIKSYHLIF